MSENEVTTEIFVDLIKQGKLSAGESYSVVSGDNQTVFYVKSIKLKDGRVIKADYFAGKAFGMKKNLEVIDKGIVEEEEHLNEEISLIMANTEVVLDEPDLYSPDYGNDSL